MKTQVRQGESSRWKKGRDGSDKKKDHTKRHLKSIRELDGEIFF